MTIGVVENRLPLRFLFVAISLYKEVLVAFFKLYFHM